MQKYTSCWYTCFVQWYNCYFQSTFLSIFDFICIHLRVCDLLLLPAGERLSESVQPGSIRPTWHPSCYYYYYYYYHLLVHCKRVFFILLLLLRHWLTFILDGSSPLRKEALWLDVIIIEKLWPRKSLPIPDWYHSPLLVFVREGGVLEAHLKNFTHLLVVVIFSFRPLSNSLESTSLICIWSA